MNRQIALMVQKLLAAHLINLSLKSTDRQVASICDYVLHENINYSSEREMSLSKDILAHEAYLKQLYNKAKEEPATWKLPSIKEMPPGSPIGCGEGGR